MLYGVIWLITAPLRLLPNATLPDSITTAISTANTYLAAINFILPLSTFLTIFGIILTIETFILIYKLINWLIRKIPTIN
jgi:hypothetical protein